MKVLALLFLSLLVTNVFSNQKILGIDLDQTDSTHYKMIVNLNSDMQGSPELNIGPNHVQIVLKDINVWPKIDKKSGDINLLAYQFDRNLARVRAIIPYSLLGFENKVSVKNFGKKIEISFPKTIEAAKTAVVSNTNTIVATKDQYDEKYLDQLIQEKKLDKNEDKKDNSATMAQKPNVVSENLKNHLNDEVKVAQASPEIKVNSENSSFSFAGYVGKFVAFLGVVLLLFYGVVQLMKKGVLGKGKLGFLNNTQIVTVLSTTYLSPKRSLLLIKAHKQIFLVAQSETGMQYLSEITDTAGLLKEGERAVSGNNFDTDLDRAENINAKIKLKDLDQLDTSSNLADLVNGDEEKVSFSDQIKKKMKSLKQLQQ